MAVRSNFLFLRSMWNRAFAVVFAFVTLASGLFWLDSFRISEAEMKILVIGKTPVVQGSEVAENLSALSANLSFAERALKKNEENETLASEFALSSPDERKAKWNELVRVKRLKESGVLSVRTRSEEAETSKDLAMAASQELLATASFYYNVRTDVDLRIVEGPLVSVTVASPFLYLLTSLGTSFAVTTLFFSLLSIIPRLWKGKGTPEKAYPGFTEGDSVPYIDPRKFIPRKPKVLSYEHRTEEEKNEANEEAKIREEILSSAKTEAEPSQASQKFPDRSKGA